MGHYKSFHLPESTEHFPPPRDFRTKHVKIELAVDFGKKRISGTCSMDVEPIREGIRSVVLDACSMEISVVKVGGAPAKFDYDNKRLTIPLSAAPTGPLNIAVTYSTTPKVGVYFTGPDEGHPEREVQAWSHSEAEHARYWFPCFDHLQDKSSSELTITVPKGFTVVSNGELVSKSETGDHATFHWREDLPHPPYLRSFVAARLGEIRQESEGVPLYYYFPEKKREDVLRYFGETPKMISVFNEATGVKYPYKKYAQCTVEEFIFGGMENFNATTLTTTYYPDAASEEDFQPSYAAPHRNNVALVAHELAHQWFGDLVTCASWSEAFLNEGFATYLQGIYYERTRGVEWFRWDMAKRAEQYFDEDKDTYRRAIVDRKYFQADDLFDMATYEKGEWMLHELRYIVGDKAFFEGVKEYLNSKSFGNADHDDLRKAMEKVSGLSLEQFFEQAFLKPGHPELEIEYIWDSGTKMATVRIRQVQNLENGTPIFSLPVEVVFYTESGRRSRRVVVDSKDQSFSFELDSEPRIVEVDPEHWILKKTNFRKSLRLLANQLEGSIDHTSRVEAATALGDTKNDAAVPALRAAAAREQFWEVRVCAITALGKIGSEAALKALLELGVPGDRRVRRGVAGALGEFKGEKAEGVLKRLLQEDASPFVRCEAALSIAKCMGEASLPFLKQAMEVRTVNDVLLEACLEAMGKLNDESVRATIREYLAYGKPTRGRIGAMRAIKARGRVFEDELAMLKSILLKDIEFRVRSYITSALVPALKDARFADTLLEASKKDIDPRIRHEALRNYYELSQSEAMQQTINRLKAEVEQLKAGQVAPTPKSS